MKKIFSLTLLTLFLMFFSFIIFPIKVFAAEWVTPEDWFNYISQFDFGYAKGEIDNSGVILIVEEPTHEYDGWYIEYNYNHYYYPYFDSELNIIVQLLWNNEDVLLYLEEHYEEFDGHFYWNFEQKYWQVGYYELSELDYYKQRVDDLEDEISLLEDEISLLENEISSLENEIQQLEEALDLEYDRGFNDGYEAGYNEGLLVENNNDIIKWFVPLVVLIIIVGIFESIKIFKRRE